MNDHLVIWELSYNKRPWTTNAERNWHHHKRAKYVKEWREEFCKLALAADIPRLEYMFIEATPNLADRKFQDTAACNPAVKAAIDGIVDAGVIPDDSQEWLKWIKFHPCKHTPGKNSLTIKVIGKVEQNQ